MAHRFVTSAAIAALKQQMRSEELRSINDSAVTVMKTDSGSVWAWDWKTAPSSLEETKAVTQSRMNDFVDAISYR